MLASADKVHGYASRMWLDAAGAFVQAIGGCEAQLFRRSG